MSEHIDLDVSKILKREMNLSQAGDALIDIIATFIPKKNRDYLSEKKWNDIQWRKQLLDILIVLEYRPIILWFFLHTNYFHLEDFENQRIRIQENIELLKQYYPPQLYFNTIDDLYNAVPNTNLLFSLSYQNRSNKTILVNYCKLLRTICPDLNYSMNTSSIQTSSIQTCSIQSSSTQSTSIENNSNYFSSIIGLNSGETFSNTDNPLIFNIDSDIQLGT